MGGLHPATIAKHPEISSNFAPNPIARRLSPYEAASFASGCQSIPQYRDCLWSLTTAPWPSMPKTATLTSGPRQRIWIGTILLLLCAFAGLYHLHTINRDFPPNRSDLQPVKLGIQAILRGENPYSDDVTRQIQLAYYGHALSPSGHTNQMAYVYPPHTAVVLAFLAPFPWQSSRLIFVALAILLTLTTVPVWIHVSGARWNASSTLLAVIGVMGCWPTLWALRLQQPTLLVAAVVALACLLLTKNRETGQETGAALLLALATIKPQLIAILTLWFIVRAVALRRPRFLIVFAAATLLLLGAGEYLVPHGLMHWIRAGTHLAQTDQQTTFTLLLGDWPGRLANLIIAVFVAIYLWRLRRAKSGSSEFASAISVALAATVALMPTGPAMIYNQVLLVPACFVLLQLRPPRQTSAWPARLEHLARAIALALLAWGFLAQMIAALGEGLTGPRSIWRALPFENPLLAPAVTIALLLSGFMGLRKPERGRTFSDTSVAPTPFQSAAELLRI